MPQIDLEPEHYRETASRRRRWGQAISVGVAAIVAIGWMATVWFGREQPVVVVGVTTLAVVLIAAVIFIGAWLSSSE